LATVITNLLSAIPYFGQDIVESKNLTELITIHTNLNLNPLLSIIPVLPTVGTVNQHALKKVKSLRLDKKEFLSIPHQFISFLVGLIDGDGYIQITKTTKGFIAIKLIIGLHLEDLSTLEYINSILKIGKITIQRDHRSPTCKLIINRTDLQEILFPLLIHHNIFFLTYTRRAQFDLAMFIFKSDLKLFSLIPNINKIDTNFNLPTKAEDYLKLAFFNNWLVGFTNAEGSFLIKSNNDACFQLKQRIHVELFEAFKLLFNTNRKILIEQEKYNQFSVSSKNDIQKVIEFFSFSGNHSLIGLKCIQYFNWLNTLQKSSRYCNLKFPK
jgi:hypothetical protein